ncbi:hypothetical protein F5884DRAFT_682357 [Xylogone sp. PMI_703]|nr:hypothetical protein F5884DRAFT_682357 [Xylogone sp. PMI_703]
MRSNQKSSSGDDGEFPSEAEFAVYSQLADLMNRVHNGFRRAWNSLYASASAGEGEYRMSDQGMIQLGLNFCRSLEGHHRAEERVVYPVLAPRMPAFREGSNLLLQHEEVHAGLEKMRSLLNNFESGEKEFSLQEIKACMDGYHEVLWQHMDEEVEQLSPIEMMGYWTIDEMESEVNSIFS